MTLKTSLILLGALAAIHASPFELTKEYIERYRAGMQDLIKTADGYQPKEYSFDEMFKDKEVLKHPHEFDFVVVGAGTSGAALAARLTEVPEYSVLLLEAGQPESAITKIPALHPHVARLHQWGYHTTPQAHWCQAHEDRRCPIPAAKMVGGTTATSEMVYNRGNRRDFDAWADEENKQWCYDDLLPYFKRSENAHLQRFDRKFHASGGPQSVEDADVAQNITASFLKAGEALQYPVVDYNGKEQLGFGSVQLLTLHGSRASAFASYVEPMRRKNLYVLKANVVVQLLISPHTKEAQGVKYIDPSGKVKTVRATKEVLLAAGAINTAKLLMVSGVGPAEELKAHGVECLVDLPVGAHLRDHPRVDLHFKLPHGEHQAAAEMKEDAKVAKVATVAKEKRETSADDHKHTHADLTHDPASPLEQDLLHYLKNAHGALTQPATKALAQVKTPSSKAHPKLPDVQLALRQDYHVAHDHPDHYIISVSLNHPQSHGDVKLASSDLLKFPLVNPNFYTDEDELDAATMKEGLRLARAVAHHMGLHEIDDPHCSPDNVKSDSPGDRDECIIKRYTRASGDFTGTARMGSDEHKNVVDDELQVHGVHKLRVVDLAVVPVTITGDVRATGIIIAEKAADLIKHAWK